MHGNRCRRRRRREQIAAIAWAHIAHSQNGSAFSATIINIITNLQFTIIANANAYYTFFSFVFGFLFCFPKTRFSSILARFNEELTFYNLLLFFHFGFMHWERMSERACALVSIPLFELIFTCWVGDGWLVGCMIKIILCMKCIVASFYNTKLNNKKSNSTSINYTMMINEEKQKQKRETATKSTENMTKWADEGVEQKKTTTATTKKGWTKINGFINISSTHILKFD